MPPDGADAVDDFLFESKLGFCEQIASTLVIMLRSQGVPARLATGYVPGERDRVAGVWKVRASDAHAWVEVWFPVTGWEAFDPTADVPLAGDVGNGTVGGDLIGATISSVVAYRLHLVALAAIAVVLLVAVRVAMVLRYRRRRGRWGVLQDRFTALADLDDGTPPTNPARAGQVHGPADGRSARRCPDGRHRCRHARPCGVRPDLGRRRRDLRTHPSRSCDARAPAPLTG